MEILGHVVVTVSYPELPSEPPAVGRKRVSFPLVRSTQPGSVHLTNERIAEILDEEDAAPPSRVS
jgi:hypothetical protein